MRVRVYFNLRSHKYSIIDKQTGRVVMHADQIALKNCRLIVSQAGRKRVLKQKRKNVHAFVEGDLLMMRRDHNGYSMICGCAKKLSYNPYKDDSFVTISICGERRPVASNQINRVWMDLHDNKPVMAGMD